MMQDTGCTSSFSKFITGKVKLKLVSAFQQDPSKIEVKGRGVDIPAGCPCKDLTEEPTKDQAGMRASEHATPGRRFTYQCFRCNKDCFLQRYGLPPVRLNLQERNHVSQILEYQGNNIHENLGILNLKHSVVLSHKPEQTSDKNHKQFQICQLPVHNTYQVHMQVRKENQINSTNLNIHNFHNCCVHVINYSRLKYCTCADIVNFIISTIILQQTAWQVEPLI